MNRPASPPRADLDSCVVGRSAAARELERELALVAASEVTVLIEGESGSGKGVVARRLHALSARAGGPFVEVSLPALSPTLVEAELFGHVEGAFTGASGERRGRFALAQGGTLLLDGLESLPEAFQPKLLRVLQEREVEPLGAERALPIDVRVLATSSRDLHGLVQAGRFRSDLYYRLAVVRLVVPPLRSRLADLPELVELLARRIAQRSRVPERAIGPEVLARLARHTWPGNVRELENALERLLVLAATGPGTAVDPEELGFLGEALPGEASRLAREALALGLGVDELGRAMLEEAVLEERGNLSAAARRLGLSRRTLDYRLQRARAARGGGEEAP